MNPLDQLAAITQSDEALVKFITADKTAKVSECLDNMIGLTQVWQSIANSLIEGHEGVYGEEFWKSPLAQNINSIAADFLKKRIGAEGEGNG